LALIAPPAIGQGKVPTRTAKEDLRIGLRVEDSLLFSVGNITLLPHGAFMVGTAGSSAKVYSLRIYDSLGRFQRVLGRYGKGPGEYVSPHAGLHGDSIWFSDFVLSRLTVFKSTLELQRTVPIGRGEGARRLAFLQADGTILLYPDLPGLIGWWDESGPGKESKSASIPVVRVSQRGDSIGTFTIGTYSQHSAKLGGVWQTFFWDDYPLLEFYPNGHGLVFVERRANPKDLTFTVSRFAADGKRIFRTVVPYRPLPLTRADRDTAMARRLRRSTSARERSPHPPTRAELADYQRIIEENEWLPPHLPPVSALALGGDGSVWVGREEVEGERHWLRFTADGIATFDVVLPGAYQVVAATGDVIWCSSYTDDGVSFLVRLRLK
jgi:hypothetical protein